MTRWTVLLYLAGHDELEPHMARTLLGLEALGPPAGVEVVVQLARAPFSLLQPVLPHRLPTVIDGDWSGVRRYRLRTRPEGGAPDRYHSELLADLGPVNMANPQTLRQFLAFGQERFPADRRLLAISAHGLGFPGLIYDLASGPHPWHMSTRGLRHALRRSGVPLDILIMDLCSANSLEAICELAGPVPVSDWLVIPAGPSPRWNLDYPALLSLLTAPESDLPARMARELERSSGERMMALALNPDRWRAVALAAWGAPPGSLPADSFRLAAETCVYPPGGRNAQFLIWQYPEALPALFHPFYRPLRFCRLSGWNRRLAPVGEQERVTGMARISRHLLRIWMRLLRPDRDEAGHEELLDRLQWGERR